MINVTDRLAGWLAGWLADWLAGWLAWLAEQTGRQIGSHPATKMSIHYSKYVTDGPQIYSVNLTTKILT